MKFTFKTEKSTGAWRSFSPDQHYIKLKKKEVGQIEDKKPYRIRLQVVKDDINEDGNPNCTWKWIRLKKESETLQEAKDFLNAVAGDIIAKYKINLED